MMPIPERVAVPPVSSLMDDDTGRFKAHGLIENSARSSPDDLARCAHTVRPMRTA